MNLYRVPRGGYMADKGLSFVCDVSSSFTCLYWFVLVCTGLYWFAVVGGCCSGEPIVLQCIPAVLTYISSSVELQVCVCILQLY